MPGPEKLDPGDAVLLRYLLGALPADEAEPIEEASIVDDDLAARLNVMERDLIDNYIRGEMEGPGLARFQSWYLSSPLRVQRVEAARAILRIADAMGQGVELVVAPGGSTETTHETTPAIAPVPEPIAAPVSITPKIAPNFSYGAGSSSQKSSGWGLGKLGVWPVLGFAAALLILVAALGVLSSRNKELQHEVAQTKQPSGALTAQLDDQSSPPAAANSSKSVPPAALAREVENVATVTMFLPAPTRGANTIPKVDVPAGTGLVVLSLGLAASDVDSYRAQFLNPTTNKIVWHSGALRPGSDGTYVSVAVPASVLRAQTYLIQLMHDAANGRPELLGTYPFRVEVK